MPHMASTLPVNVSNVHTGRLPVASQHSFAPAFNSSYLPRSTNNPAPQFRTQKAPLPSFQGLPLMRQGPIIASQPQKGFPITIRPANTSSNLSIRRAPGPIANFPQQQIINSPHFMQGTQQGPPSSSRGAININIPQNLPINHHQIQAPVQNQNQNQNLNQNLNQNQSQNQSQNQFENQGQNQSGVAYNILESNRK